MNSKLTRVTLAALLLGATGLAAADDDEGRGRNKHGPGGWGLGPTPVSGDRGHDRPWGWYGRPIEHQHGYWHPRYHWEHGGYHPGHYWSRWCHDYPRHYRWGYVDRHYHGYRGPYTKRYADYGDDITIIFRGRLD